MENWKEIPKTNGYYWASDFGRIWSARTGVLKTPPSNKGYPHFNMCQNGSSKRGIVHRVVAELFIENPKNAPQVNHKNGIKHDNRVENLEWVTNDENRIHFLTVLGGNYNVKPSKRKKRVFAKNIQSGEIIEFGGIRECARYLGIPYQAVQGICHKRNKYKYKGWTFYF